MNKTEFVAAVAQRLNLSKAKAAQVVDAIFNPENGVIAETIRSEAVVLTGFGAFSKKERPGRVGRNPQTGGSVMIAARNVVKFKSGTGLTASVQ